MNESRGMSYSIYVDYNDNGVFTDEGELVLQMGNTAPGTISGSFTIRSDASLGTHRLRVRADYYGNDYPQGPCTQLQFGETEDYGLTVIASCAQPTTQATIGSYSYNPIENNTTVNWTRGNGTGGILVVGRLTSSILTDPAGSLSYTANSNFGSGTDIGTGNFVVYNGTGTSVKVTGLIKGASYAFTCYEYNNTGTCYKIPGSTSEIVVGYCVPPPSEYANWFPFYLKNVSTMGGLTNFSNTTGPEGNSYGDYSSNQIAVAVRNTQVILSGTSNRWGMEYTVFVDYNDNGVFDNEGELVLHMVSENEGTISGSFTIPVNAPLGTHRMRVKGEEYGTPYNPDPCAQLESGETEDYGLTILAPCIQPTTQASALSISNTTSTQTDVNWTNGSGDGRMVVARLNSTAAIAPSHGTSYVANTVFGSGNTTGAGNFVVFSGAGSGPVTVTGLSAGKAYTFTVYEFNNTRECYLLSGLSDSIITPLLTSSTLTGFSTVCQGSTTGPNSFTITGTNLSSADVTVAALPGFTYSETPGGIYSTTLSFLQPGGSCSKQIFVKFSPTAAQSYNGNIVVSGGGASGVNVAATGKGAEIPVVTATPTSETILSGFATDINLSSQIGGTTFVWGEPVISGSINGASAGSGSTISQTLTNTGESAGTVTYNITTFATCTSSVTSVVITVEAPVPMAYTSSNTVQLNNGTVLYPSTTTNIIQMQVVTTGGASPFNMTSMAFSTNGTTNASKDIANAKVYYTGTSPVFATTTQFGSTYNNPNGSFTVKGNQPLSAGINYFWLSYELPSTPNLGDAIDGCFTQFVMSGAGGTQTPATTCPAGNATINSDYCIPQQSINYQSGSFYLTNISTTGGITNFTSYPDSYYSNSYANYSASKIASQAQNSPITLNLGYYSDYGMYEFYYYVYIDFNDNGVFSDPGEMYATQVSEDGSTTSITFTIPADAPVGTHRMRVRADILSRVYDECSQLYYGETDDYGLTVTAACTATITPGGSTALCQGESVMLTSNPGASYVWSTGATTQFITVSSAGDYAVNVTNADGCSSTSTATTVTVSQPETWYLDADNDGHYVSSQSSCGSPGAGYNTTATISGDCDDNDATKWQSTLVYVDADADGYTVGEATSICYGETIPSGYSTTSLGTDCDDNNPSIQTGQTWYLDADNDGHYVSSQSSCSSPGEGYNITATQIGDCDDSNPNKWQSALLYVDFDGDGYTVGAATSVCYGATVPPGYAVTTSGSDYNDGDPSIHQNTVISGIDASSSSNPVALGSGAILSATISPAISGVTVTFSVDPGTGVTTTYTAVTNSSGIATTAPVSGLSVNLYKVIATAGGVTSDAAYLAVYDPNSSFITGGGWIISPVGALIAQPLLSGKANFGFVAKYKKGKSEVDGDTEFQFQNGDFNFESSALNAGSLVISGSKGTYRGEGTVNGQGNYGFMVSAVDGQISGSGGTDLFRIKIWDKSNGNSVVYDNNTGKDENGVPSTTLGGGSIVIHTAKGKNSRVMNTGTKVEITNSSSEELTGTGKLTVTVMPNPTSYYFTLDMKSLSKEKIKVTVTDIVGRVIEQRTGIPANSTIQLAHQYHPGVYIAQFLQGNDKVTIRLIKEGK
jgi:hypothetical protein